MSTERAEVERALTAVLTTLNEGGFEAFDSDQVQAVISDLLGDDALAVDPGGGIHDDTGARVAVIRRTPSGEWIADAQNENAAHSGAEVPTPGSPSKLRGMMQRLKKLGS